MKSQCGGCTAPCCIERLELHLHLTQLPTTSLASKVIYHPKEDYGEERSSDIWMVKGEQCGLI